MRKAAQAEAKQAQVSKSAEPLDNDPQFAEIFVRELRKKTWSKPARDLLNAISEKLRHNDFVEIAEAMGRFVETS